MSLLLGKAFVEGTIGQNAYCNPILSREMPACQNNSVGGNGFKLLTQPAQERVVIQLLSCTVNGAGDLVFGLRSNRWSVSSGYRITREDAR